VFLFKKKKGKEDYKKKGRRFEKVPNPIIGAVDRDKEDLARKEGIIIKEKPIIS
jgi:hypothetical protein